LQKQLSIIKVCGTFESGTSEKSEDALIKKFGQNFPSKREKSLKKKRLYMRKFAKFVICTEVVPHTLL
jgi:hypothetical protein